MQIESITHLGLQRANNEDRYLVNRLDDDRALLALADGMGGHAAGEVAAEIAIEAFEGYRPRGPDIGADLVEQIEEVQRNIVERCRAVPSLSGMGTTLTVVFLTWSSAFWAHVGDTRIYHLHQGSLIRITEDHTIAGILLKKGDITREQARLHPYGSVLTKCMGCERHQPDSGVFDLAQGDLILLSSDGLHDLMTDEQIADILSARLPITEKLHRMLSVCLERGGRDNITALIAGI